MRHQNLKCEITGESFKEMQSRDIGHVPRIGNIQTKALQTSGTDYHEEDSTKPGMDADWLPQKQSQIESRMHKNLAEATSDVEDDEPLGNTTNLTASADLSSSTSTRSVAAGMQIPMCMQFPSRTIKMLKSAMRNPPVTVSTLGELNLNWMTHYVNLRCDINFDHDLHFTPIKGPRGEEKRRQAIDYWIALEAEFRIYHHPPHCMACESVGAGMLGSFQPRLSTMFQDLKDLLKTLVPDKDHDQVATNLDIDLTTQQVEKGVLDVGRLSRWLAKLLKSHCAPMRDESAEAMAEKLEFGANTGDLATLINGLESLFGFLEAMKLDVANHQIRTFRYILIEETVSFQQAHFRKKIAEGKLDLAAAEDWYTDMRKRYIPTSSQSSHKDAEIMHFHAFLHGLVSLCSSSPLSPPPPITLHYDASRLSHLRADVQDLVVLQLCTSVFTSLLSRLRCHHPITPHALATLQHRLLTIAEQDSESGEIPWNEKAGELALEITRAAFVVASYPHPAPRIPAEAFEATQQMVRDVFVTGYEDAEAGLLEGLFAETVKAAGAFGRMSTREISEGQRVYQLQRQGGREAETGMVLPDVESMGRMVAHVGVVHWRVWRDMVYMRDGEEGMGEGLPGKGGGEAGMAGRNEGIWVGGGKGEDEGLTAGIERQVGKACDNT
jgi:hypothetical protein